MVKKNFRTISKQTYVIAGVITALIFCLGLLLGFIIEGYRYDLIMDVNQEQDTNSLSLQLQYLSLTTLNDNNNCALISATLNQAVSELSNSLSQVIASEEEKTTSSAREINLQRRYTLDNLRYWLLARESQKSCNLDAVQILYFYKQDCPSCPNQGTVLSYYKRIFDENLLVFPINIDLAQKEPMVNIVMSQYNITKVPSVVINDKKYEGVLDKEALGKIICMQLPSHTQCQ